MSQSAVVRVKQLTSRLENATASERLDALQEFQTLARTEAKLIGEYALQCVLDFLKERGSAEEYQESLDLIDRLIKTRDRDAAIANTGIILSSTGNVELLIDLLEHEDLTVGVMTSQILTEVHAIDPLKLEACIQECPAGMNKLLQRLPDRSREEVSNQAIVLVQQLTVHNEEMKKTVVFNEGFEILFGIIRSEGGAKEGGIVIQDCLQICCNILLGSEICQRFFFGMGVDWVLKLHTFFDPNIMESLKVHDTLSGLGGADRGGGDEGEGAWFTQQNRVECAVLAVRSLCGALQVVNQKHQRLIAMKTDVICSAASWLARRGPNTLVEASLVLLSLILEKNPEVASQVADMMVEVPPCVSGRTHPIGVEVPAVYFGWRPLPTDDRRIISLPALLAERYVYSSSAWSPPAGSKADTKDTSEGTTSPDGLSVRCLHVLETFLQADSMTCDLMVQYILAPPPPTAADEGYAKGDATALEAMRPLGSILLNTLLEGSNRVLNGANLPMNIMKNEMNVVERSANVLALLFVNGGMLGRELSTVISTSHTSIGGKGTTLAPQPLLPYLLGTVGRAAKVPLGGHVIFVAILRLLSVVASGCDVAARQMLEDPTNFFVVDLASTLSESAGIPPVMQVSSCLFLGACFVALKDKDTHPGVPGGPTGLTRNSFLSMVDSRVGLNRFVEVLRRPLATRGTNNLASELFFSPGFRLFYENQVDLIRKGIFDFYSGIGKNMDNEESPLQQIILMQKDRIKELEDVISGGNNIENDNGNNGNKGNTGNNGNNGNNNESNEEQEIKEKIENEKRQEMEEKEAKERNEKKLLEEHIQGLTNENISLSNRITDYENTLKIAETKNTESESTISRLTNKLTEAEEKNNLLNSEKNTINELLSERILDLDSMVRSESVIVGETELLRKRAESAESKGRHDVAVKYEIGCLCFDSNHLLYPNHHPKKRIDKV